MDGSGDITFSEFVTYASEINHNFSQEELRAAFELFDADHDGLIDQREVHDIILYGMSEIEKEGEDFDHIVSEIDLNHDGKIDF